MAPTASSLPKENVHDLVHACTNRFDNPDLPALLRGHGDHRVHDRESRNDHDHEHEEEMRSRFEAMNSNLA